MKQPVDFEDCAGFADWAALAEGTGIRLIIPSRSRGLS
jgi:hypothetical protein